MSRPISLLISVSECTTSGSISRSAVGCQVVAASSNKCAFFFAGSVHFGTDCSSVGTVRFGWELPNTGDAREMQTSTEQAETGRPHNEILRRLSERDFSLIEPHLERLNCASDIVLFRPGDEVDRVHFPCGPSMASLVVPIEDGRDVETLSIGREGAIGGIVSQGSLPAFARIVVKFGGPFVRLDTEKLEAAKSKSPPLHDLFARYADCLVAQFTQSTACNAVHSIQQRAAKLIIAAIESTGDDVVPITHEKLAAMLGVGRSYASRIIDGLKVERLVETQRGAIRVRNPAGLRKISCLCNQTVKKHFEAVLGAAYSEDDHS
jgi:hypothetical protein